MEKERKIGPFVRAWLARDGLYIACLMVALVLCVYVYLNIGNLIAANNQAWEEHIAKECFCSGLEELPPPMWTPNKTISDVIQDENKNRRKDS